MEILTWIMNHLSDIVMVASAVVGVASLVTALTPTPKDDAFVSKVRDFLDRLSILTHKDAKGTVKLPGTDSQPHDE